MKRIKTIIDKEWAEVFKNRLVVFTTIFMPLLFTALPLVILYFTQSANLGNALGDLPEQFQVLCQGIDQSVGCMQYYILTQFIVLFMMLPVIIPVNIAAYSVVGEKTTRSLEPLLATPITTAELLIGKNLAAATPAILATWGGFSIFALGSYLMTSNAALIRLILSPLWLVAILVLTPLLSLLAVNFAMMVSSRVTDPRVAEQLSVLVILPLLVVFLGQVMGFIVINQLIILILALVVLLLDAALIPITIRIFQRENILTRWK